MGRIEIRDYMKYSLIGIIFAILIGMFCIININILKNINEPIKLNENWNFKTQETNKSGNINLPNSIKGVARGEIIVVENVLPDKLMKSANLLIWTELQRVKIYLENQEIYSIEKSELQRLGKEPEGQWTFIELPEGSEGKKIKIEYISEYKNTNGEIQSILIGDKLGCILYLIRTYGIGIVKAIMVFCVGIILILISMGIRKLKSKGISILYLGMLNIVYSFWIFSGNKVSEVLFKDTYVISEVNIISLYLLPIILVLFIKEVVYTEKSKMLNINIGILVMYIIITLVMHFSNIVHFKEHLIIFHSLLILTAINLCIFTIKSKKINFKNNIATRVFCSFLILAGILDIINYYNSIDFKYNSISMKVIILLTIIYTFKTAKKYVELNHKEKENKLYKKLALTDTLTDIPNRLAFNNRMDEINSDLKSNIGTELFIFDLNNLKKVNDNFGHAVGDKYIRESAKKLTDIFSEYGEVYRIGGDEFAFISERKVPFQICTDKLDENLKCNFKGISMGISYGYKAIENDSNDVYEIYSMADKEMYRVKALHKKINNKLIL